MILHPQRFGNKGERPGRLELLLMLWRCFNTVENPSSCRNHCRFDSVAKGSECPDHSRSGGLAWPFPAEDQGKSLLLPWERNVLEQERALPSLGIKESQRTNNLVIA
jgi:hypothetical protein